MLIVTSFHLVPSSSPVVVCGLCDVVVRGGLRDGIVRWQVSPGISVSLL